VIRSRAMAVSGCVGGAIRVGIGAGAGDPIVSSLKPSSNAPSGMSSSSSSCEGAIALKDMLTGGSEISGGEDGLLVSSQPRCASRLCRVIDGSNHRTYTGWLSQLLGALMGVQAANVML
jgi:hypothetical protein